jgi:putative FmdB family regulatory protein
MPLFDFRCPACDKTFELLVRGSQTPQCPHCAGESLEKQVSRPAPPGQSAAMVRRARAQAKREGHFSHH